jgi:predicted GIY-YIG superfamily endonuclease
MNSGVYKITCIINGNYYYGSSVNLKSRFINHINKLRSQKHRNHRLQRTFNKHGEDSITFEVVEYCDSHLTTVCEQKYLNIHINHKNCMNFCKSASAPMAGLKFSEDHKRKMAESQFRNKYIFTYQDGIIEEFNSLSEASKRFEVRNSIISRWFKRKNLGRNHGTLNKFGIIKAEKTGDENVVLQPYPYKLEPWILAGSYSRSQYYKEKRKKQNQLLN